MTVLTSTMRMQLDAAGFVRDAKQVADAVAPDVEKVDALNVPLTDSGASGKLQATLLKLSSSTTQIEGVKRALIDFRKEQRLVGKAWGDLTKEKAAFGTFESATAATMRAVVKSETDASAAILRDAEQRAAALLSKEATLRDKLLAEDRKAEDKHIAMVAAAAAERATIGGREVAARAAIEAEVTAKHRAGIVARENATRAARRAFAAVVPCASAAFNALAFSEESTSGTKQATTIAIGVAMPLAIGTLTHFASRCLIGRAPGA